MSISSLLSVTPAAADHIKSLLVINANATGLKIALRNRGCSGMSYNIDLANEELPNFEVVNEHGVKIFIDPAAIMFIIGSTLDYKKSDFASGLVFANPNAKSFCGCGESFNV